MAIDVGMEVGMDTEKEVEMYILRLVLINKRFQSVVFTAIHIVTADSPHIRYSDRHRIRING